MTTVYPGSSYSARVIVTNTSTRRGLPVAATLTLTVSGIVGSTPLSFFPSWADVYLGPGESYTLDFLFTVPYEPEGATGEIWVFLWDPTGAYLAHSSESLIVEYLSI